MAQTSSVIAANRFGLGARPGDLAAIGGDPRGWLLGQVERDPGLPSELAGLPHSSEVLLELREFFQQRQKLKRQLESDPEKDSDVAAELRKQMRKDGKGGLRGIYLTQAEARMTVAATTERPFYERLVHFWTNHFATSADKLVTIGTAATLENEVIRKHVTGRFVEMLIAVEQHPAMITYLDNQGSIGPNSKAAAWAQRRRGDLKLGINENLAREILELHTLGVNGGYTQQDVTTFAQVITGWSIAGMRGPFKDGEPGYFIFRDVMHEPGAKTVLGNRYRDDGVGQGEAVLRDLAGHPSTAHFIATKLVRHFIADEPPAEAVARVEQTFTESDGNLPDVYAALIACPEAWDPALAKLKTPQDYVVSTFRALDFAPERPEQALGPLRVLGQLPYMPGSPAGWPDTAADWGGSDAILKRVELAVAVGDRVGNRVNPLDVADSALGPVLGEHSRTWIGRAESPAQGLALLLASPEFQRR